MSEPFFSIVMRTVGNRDITLRRAIQSVVNQSFTDWELIIVVDSLDQVSPLEVSGMARFYDDTGRIKIHHFYSRGRMENTSNFGLQRAVGEYIAVHDDDDSWNPKFLEEMHKEIQESDQPFPAIMTHFNKIFEIMDLENNSVREVCRVSAVPWLQSLQLGFVLAGNIFPPICLVYKRDILSYIGMYDESLKVLGDWDFLIRLMYFTQIKVLKKPLANYHIRVNPSGIYGNSINTEGWSNLHIEYESYVRHKYQYTKVLLPNFEKKDVGSDIVNAKASKTYWHWDYVREVKSILNIKPDYIENMKSIVDKIGEEFNSDSPLKVYLYGAGKLFEELIEDRRFIDLINYLEVRGMVDSKFDNGNSREEERAFSTEALREKDIDVIIVTLENPEQVLGILKSKVGPNVKIYCIASSY